LSARSIPLSTARMYAETRGTFTGIGFVLIYIEPTREKEVYQKLTKIKDIVELYPLFGEYDLIAKVEADSYDAIGKLVVSKIRAIEGVKATKTLARVAFCELIPKRLGPFYHHCSRRPAH